MALRLLCLLQAEQCLPEAPETNPSVWLLSFQPSLEASVSQRPRGKRTSVLTASTCAHPEPRLLLQPPAGGERCLALGTEAAMLPVPAKGESPSTPGEASIAERLRSKSPCRLWRQMCTPGGLHPIPQERLRLGKMCGAWGGPRRGGPGQRTAQGPCPVFARTEAPQLPWPGSGRCWLVRRQLVL